MQENSVLSKTIGPSQSVSQEDAGVHISEPAYAHIQKSLRLAKESDVLGIRLGVKKAGCSGYEYVLAYLYPKDLNTVTDIVLIYPDFKIAIDAEVYGKFLKGGTVIDYAKETLKEGLKFNNPNVSAECGCGESFTLKVAEE
jgi:iron-sulfur cluster assembly accessory protein